MDLRQERDAAALFNTSRLTGVCVCVCVCNHVYIYVWTWDKNETQQHCFDTRRLTRVYIYIYIYIYCIYVCMDLRQELDAAALFWHTQTHRCVCTYVCIQVHMYVWIGMYGGLQLCACVYMYVRIYGYMDMVRYCFTYIDMCVFVWVGPCNVHSCKYKQTHIKTHIHIHMQAI
jgi:hypothetical protein